VVKVLKSVTVLDMMEALKKFMAQRQQFSLISKRYPHLYPSRWTGREQGLLRTLH
jgi:hypothetical protein